MKDNDTVPGFTEWFLDFMRGADVSEAFKKSRYVENAMRRAFAAGRHKGRVETILEEWPGFRAFQEELEKL